MQSNRFSSWRLRGVAAALILAGGLCAGTMTAHAAVPGGAADAAAADASAPAPGRPPPGPQGRSKDVNGPPKRATGRLYDFTGVWSVIQSGRPQGPVPAKGFIDFKPAYEAKRAALEQQDKTGQVIKGRNSRCTPAGLPDMMTFGFTAFAYADFVFVEGGYGTVRPVWLNRKEHTPYDKLFPTYQGESIGHWEGDTLVIDTIGLDPTNEITYGLPANDPKLHVIEHWKLLDRNTLRVVITVDSPAALEKPWTYVMVYARRPETDLVGELTYCDQPLVNNSLDLTPPSGGYVPPGAAQ